MMETLQGIFGFIYNPDLLSNYGWRLIDGLRVTLEIVTISCTLGFLLAYPLCMARTSDNTIVRGLAASYMIFFRGTPLLCQLYLVYYGAGEIRPFLQSVGLWSFFKEAFPCCLFTFTLNTAAYQAEIFRGALASVPNGQRETAAALGLSKFRVARHVIWPQAFLVALRPLGNELIGIIKASALAAIVTVLDLTGETRYVFSRTFDFSIYLYAAIMYLLMTEGIRRVWQVIERSFSKHLLVQGKSGPQAAAAVPGAAAAAGPTQVAPPLRDGVSAG